MIDSPIVVWLKERLENCVRLAHSKTGEDRAGWLDDANHFARAITYIQYLEAKEKQCQHLKG